MNTVTRRGVIAGGAAVLAAPAVAQPAAAGTLRVVPQANLTSLDPIWTTAVVTRNHGYMVYDQLIALDERYQPRPQMVSGWETAADGLTWDFALREGLRFHDGEPVRARDCVASITRWARRDTFGQALAAVTAEWVVVDDRRFRVRLRRPFPLLASALGKSGSLPCFIMPERFAGTDAFTAITDPVGSGPFRFLKDEWNPGNRAVWARFDGYVPRDEPVSALAGGKVARVARVQWNILPDSATAANALIAGEQDYWEYPLHDLLPLLRGGRDVVVEQRLAEGTYPGLRFNHLHPPFDDPAIRAAVMLGVDQRDYMTAVVGDAPGLWEECPGFFACHTPLANTAGDAPLLRRDPAAAKAALRAAGYAGQRVVLLVPSDYPQIAAVSLVTEDLLRRIGMNVETVTTDWGTVIQRRTSREPPERGGWSVIHTTWSGGDILNPATHTYLRTNGDGAWFGWPRDAGIEAMRDAWFDVTDPAESRALAERIQTRAFAVLPYVPLGFYWQPSAWRKNLTGVFRTPTTTYWNIAKG